MTLVAQLLEQQDDTYRIFQQKLIPSVLPERIIGVRTPILRKIARQVGAQEEFLASVPHAYFEENQIHCFLLSDGTDFKQTVEAVDLFLPYVDNWATCDQLRPKVFKKHRAELLPYIYRWIKSEHTYTVRFAIGMLMTHYLEDEFDPVYLELVADIVSKEYYIRMMQAWYFATALAKQYNVAITYIERYRLEKWVHNKTIQKAIESYRISEEQKEYLIKFKQK